MLAPGDDLTTVSHFAARGLWWCQWWLAPLSLGLSRPMCCPQAYKCPRASPVTPCGRKGHMGTWGPPKYPQHSQPQRPHPAPHVANEHGLVLAADVIVRAECMSDTAREATCLSWAAAGVRYGAATRNSPNGPSDSPSGERDFPRPSLPLPCRRGSLPRSPT